MRDTTIDTVDYVVTVAVMNWLVDAGWSVDDVQRVVTLADRTGQGICDHYAAGTEATYERPAVQVVYQWCPVFELMLEPVIKLMLEPTQTPVDKIAARRRLMQLDECRRYLLTMCERSGQWDGSNEERLMIQLRDTLRPKLEQFGAASSDARPDPWTRDLITPTHATVVDAIGDDLPKGRS